MNRAFTDVQLRGDGVVGHACGDQPQYLDLAFAQPAGRRANGLQERLDVTEVGDGAQLSEQLPRLLELQLRTFLVAECSTGSGDEHAGTGRLVRSRKPTPRVGAAPQVR